ncbi:hypothetical protein MTZ49_15235 [Entomomonas sp. E2T0]|uniref:hypothetical protein n=1 Tax=Entomomonas sp. E2T0 TaxID=2930213 RepID=UPI0022283078|nr:hypothetical protein [Entomomonas sp. E2T0]UYZ83923.1 hypothetical protein MTZ49_15235 [Entomomonas sp. E2T0]
MKEDKLIKIKNIVFIITFFFVFPLISFSFSLEDDYDEDGINDKFQEETVDNTLHLKMWLSSIDKKKVLHYEASR